MTGYRAQARAVRSAIFAVLLAAMASGATAQPAPAPATDSALAELDAAVAREPDNPVVWLERGWHLAIAADDAPPGTPTGAADIARAFALDPEAARLPQLFLTTPELAQVLMADGRHDTMALLASAQIRDPALPESYGLRVRAMAYLSLGRTADALADFERLSRNLQERYPASSNGGDVYATAVRNFEFQSLWRGQALAYVQAGQGLPALLANAADLSMRGQVPVEQLDPVAVLIACRAAIEADRLPEALTLCGRAERAMGTDEELRAALEAYRGLAHERRGQRSRAIRAYRHVLGLPSDNRPRDLVVTYLRQDGRATAEAGVARLTRR